MATRPDVPIPHKSLERHVGTMWFFISTLLVAATAAARLGNCSVGRRVRRCVYAFVEQHHPTGVKHGEHSAIAEPDIMNRSLHVRLIKHAGVGSFSLISRARAAELLQKRKRRL